MRDSGNKDSNVRNIINNAIDKYYDINKEYYNDVLIFLNLISLFNDGIYTSIAFSVLTVLSNFKISLIFCINLFTSR